MNAPSEVWDRPRNVKGKIIGSIFQTCAACGTCKEKLVAKWPDGHKTYLCPRAIEHDSVDVVHII